MSATNASSSTAASGRRVADLGVHRVGWAEQVQGLVDQVAAQVEQHTARLVGVGGLPPPGRRSGAPVLEARLEACDAAQIARFDERPRRQEVAVPAAILEHRQHHARLGGGRGQLAPLRRGSGERLVDDHRDARRDRSMGELGVHPVRCGHDHEVELACRCPDRLGGVEEQSSRMGGGSASATLRVRHHDRVQAQSGDGGDERSVERLAGQAVPDQRDASWILLPIHEFFVSMSRTLPPHLPGAATLADVSLLATRHNRQRILEEGAKCELVCANCHAVRTFSRRRGVAQLG